MMEEATSQLPVGALLGLLVIAVAAAAVAWSIVAGRRQKRARHDHLVSLGFSRLTTPPDTLVTRVTGLRRRKPVQVLELRDVYHRAIAGGDLYFFEILDRDDSDSGMSASNQIAVVAPSLKLPRLMLAPQITLEGAAGDLLGRIAERALSWANARTGLEVYTFDELPAFGKHYTVLGLDEPAIRALLTTARLSRLLTMDRKYLIDGEADTLLLAPDLTTRALQQEDPLDPYTLRLDAEQLLALLRESL